MKKFFAIIATLVVTTFAFNAKAQLSGIEGMPPYKLGITVGYNSSWFSGSSSAGAYIEPTAEYFDIKNFPVKDYTITSGIQVGANLMVDASPLIPNTFARVETKYSMKGADWEDKSASITEHITLHYIEVPIHYGYAWFINENLTLMAETGPYFAMGFYGRDRMIDPKGEHFLKTFGGLIDGNRLDIGWGVQASAMISKNYQVHLAYDYGFINIANTFLQNRNLSVGFTWFFESLFE